MPPLDAEQLAAEARELKRDQERADNPPPPEGEGGDAGGPQPGAAGDDAGAWPGADQEATVENPAPVIAAALRKARDFPLAPRLVPPRMLAVFDDATIDELADALGALTVKYGPVLARWLNVTERYGPEAKAATVFLVIAFKLWLASMEEAQAASAPPAGERVVGGHDASREGRDPPPPGAAAEPVRGV